MNNYGITGFQPNRIDLNEIVDIDVKKVVIIGDGMSGKTQILITFGKKILAYLQKIYSALSILEGRKSDDTGLEVALEAFGEIYKINPAFQSWAEQQGFLIRYGNSKWNIMSVSLDTETIGFEDFQFIFPYFWNNRSYRINLFGSDVGGQNIFDHFRAVLGKIAGANDIIIVIFDKSRALSCWNSIEQVQKVVGDKISDQRSSLSNLPRIIFVGNKIDLEEHIRKQKWQDGISNSLMRKTAQISHYRKGEYQLPSLVGKKGIERTFRFKLENVKLNFADLEALIYNAIRESDYDYKTQKIMTDVNAKAMAREISAQLVFQQKVEDKEAEIEVESTGTVITILEDFGKLLFQRRPLAMQYSGGIERFHHNTSDSDSFGRVRAKWFEYSVNFNRLTSENIYSSIASASNARNLLSADVGEFFSTNALLGTGVMELWDSVIHEKLLKNLKMATSSNKDRKPKKRRIRKF